jgi:hypothetical protein
MMRQFFPTGRGVAAMAVNTGSFPHIVRLMA